MVSNECWQQVTLFFLDGKRVKTRLKSSARGPEPCPAPLPCAAVHLPQRLERTCFVRGARRQARGADRRRRGQRGQLNGDDQFSFQNAKSEIPVAIRTELLGRRLHISVWNSGGGRIPETELGPWQHTTLLPSGGRTRRHKPAEASRPSRSSLGQRPRHHPRAQEKRRTSGTDLL